MADDPWHDLNMQAKELAAATSLDRTDALTVRLDRADIHAFASAAWAAASRLVVIRVLHTPFGDSSGCPVCRVWHPCRTYTETLKEPA